jgi:hypothetical protein
MVLGFGILFMAFAEFYKFLKRRCMAPLVRHVDMTKSVTPTKAVRELDLIAVDKGATTEMLPKISKVLRPAKPLLCRPGFMIFSAFWSMYLATWALATTLAALLHCKPANPRRLSTEVKFFRSPRNVLLYRYRW